MKKISLFLMSLFVIGSAMAQTVDDWSYSPVTADNNGSVIFPQGTLGDFDGYEIKAYAVKYEYAGPADAILGIPPIDSTIVPTSNAATIDASSTTAIVVMGQDDLCGCSQAQVGDLIRFFINVDGNFVQLTNTPPVTYSINMLVQEFDNVEFSLGGADVVFGCTDPAYMEFNDAANIDDSSCATLIVEGCTDDTAYNYDATANVDDSSCYPIILGCMDSAADNYTVPTGDVQQDVNTEDGSCQFTGCMEMDADNYDSNANVAGYCQYLGCMDESACNFDAGANEDDGSCEGLIGCTDVAFMEYNASATCDDGSCVTLIVEGCTNPVADNFDLAANVDDGSCEYSGINPFGTGGSADAPNYITANNMSILIQAGTTGNLGNFSGLESGDIVFAAYETARLENAYLGYSEISGVNSAGAAVWTGSQVGMPVFGAGNIYDNGFEEAEELIFLVKKASDGIIYNAQVLDSQGNEVTITWENGEFAVINDLSVGSPFYDGCMDPTTPTYNPLATSDDGSCATPYSIGCLDTDAVNFAGEGANPTHENATNHDDVFVDNMGYNLNTHIQLATGIAANFSDDSYCQDQVEGCTDPMAHNYDPLNTQNDNTPCDWTLNGMVEYNVDIDGNILGTDYTFGAVAPDNVNDGIVDSDFDNAQVLFDEGYLDVNEHVIDNLANVMEWIDMDEERDAQELSDSLTDNYRRFFVMDSTWDADYTANDLWWNTRYDDTLADVAIWFAEDEEADSLELADTITDMQARYDANDLWWNTRYDDTLADVAIWFAEDEEADSLELADTITDMQARYDARDAWWTDRYESLLERVTGSPDGDVEAYNIGTSYYHEGAVDTENGIIAEMQSALDYHASSIEIDLHEQWNTVAYYLHHESSVIEQFISNFGTHLGVEEAINIVKNNEGLFYWPDFGYDGIGQLVPGQGYQVRVKEKEDGSGGNPNFKWDSSIAPDEQRILIPTVPSWAIEMEVENHPNDVRSLVRVVNMLGQEVNPTEQFNGEVLLYMYNDGTVEKKMVE